jgi:hypothetical protein
MCVLGFGEHVVNRCSITWETESTIASICFCDGVKGLEVAHQPEMVSFVKFCDLEILLLSFDLSLDGAR